MPRIELKDLFAAAGSTIINTPSIGLTSTLVLSANQWRRGLYVYNNGANTVYLSFDSFVSSATHMTIPVATFSTWVMQMPIYLGSLAAVRNSGTGILMITELF